MNKAVREVEKDMSRHADELRLGHPELMAIEREYCGRGLSNYIKRAWTVTEPAQPYSHGWHIDAMTQHLEAIDNGQITRLAIAVPPGSMKSLTTAVFWPSYQWGPLKRPWTRTVAMSHSEDLAARDNLKTKRMVESDWFQSHWGDTVKLRTDQSTKLNFENTATGFRQASPFKSITGKRGHTIIVDDPLSVDAADSDVERERVNQLYREALPLRMVSPEKSSILLIMQRLHESDAFGQIERHKEWGYDTLVIPMEFEPERRYYTSIGWTDPRSEDGELMFPERFPKHVVERDKAILGDYAAAGQFQQTPVPRGGGSFEWEKLGKIRRSEINFRHETIIWCRGWDFAGTDKKKKGGNRAAYTANVKLGWRVEAKRWVIDHVWRDRIGSAKLRFALTDTADRDGEECFIVFPKDPGQAGKDQSEELTALLSGYKVFAEPQTGDKETRAEPFAAQVNGGTVDMVEDEWNEDFLNELKFFPRGRYKDQIDAASSAFNQLSKKLRKKKKSPDLHLATEDRDNWTRLNG